MKRNVLISSALLMGVSPVAGAAGHTPAPERGKDPNVIFILVDDLGKEWIQQYGAADVQLPSLQKMADEGVVFTRAYSMPQSTPSRACILTGQYPYHNGWVNHYDVPRWGHGAHYDYTSNPCFALQVRERGYATCVAGKWQLNDFRLQPEAMSEMGFDEYFMWTGAEGGGDVAVSERRYWDPYIHSKTGSRQYKGEFGPTLYNEFIQDFITRNREKPFFVYYPMALTHGPLTTTPISMEAETSYEQHLGMVRYMDRLVGELFACLERNGLADETYVIFATDNGTSGNCVNLRDGRYVRGGKTFLSENGINCPFIVHVPGLEKGFVTDAIIDFTDIAPTVLDITGSRPDPRYETDGQSFLRVLQGKKQPRKERFAVSMGSLSAIYDENDRVKNVCEFRDRVIIGPTYKVYVTCDREIDRVYRIVEDPFEQHNLVATEKEAALREIGHILAAFPEKDRQPSYRKLEHDAAWDIPSAQLEKSSLKMYGKYKNRSKDATEADYHRFRNSLPRK